MSSKHPVLSGLRRYWLLAVAALLVLIALLLISAWRVLFMAMPLSEETIFVVEPGSSLSRIASRLEAQGHLLSALPMVALARWRGVSAAIQAGEYSLSPGMTPAQLLNKMVSGEQVQHRITLVEGWSFQQALDALWQQEQIQARLRGMDRAEIAAAMGLKVQDPEGMLFPDTYFYTGGSSDLELLQRAHSRLLKVLDRAWNSRAAALPLQSPYEALVLASIIEKESGDNSERGHIAGVFIRRLELGMRLQSDPTVIYGVGDSFAGDLTSEHLRTTTAYNTYRVGGLPPTPIALAGREAIEASLNPLPSDYLYFVSRGDGSHVFSSSLDEHNAAVNRFQRRQEGQ